MSKELVKKIIGNQLDAICFIIRTFSPVKTRGIIFYMIRHLTTDATLRRDESWDVIKAEVFVILEKLESQCKVDPDDLADVQVDSEDFTVKESKHLNQRRRNIIYAMIRSSMKDEVFWGATEVLLSSSSVYKLKGRKIVGSELIDDYNDLGRACDQMNFLNSVMMKCT